MQDMNAWLGAFAVSSAVLAAEMLRQRLQRALSGRKKRRETLARVREVLWAALQKAEHERGEARELADRLEARVRELELQVPLDEIIRDTNRARASGTEWYDNVQRWKHLTPVQDQTGGLVWTGTQIPEQEIDVRKVYKPDVVARPDSVQLLYVEGPYLTVKEQARHPNGKKIGRVFTVYDRNGMLRKAFNEEAVRHMEQQGQPTPPSA